MTSLTSSSDMISPFKRQKGDDEYGIVDMIENEEIRSDSGSDSDEERVTPLPKEKYKQLKAKANPFMEKEGDDMAAFVKETIRKQKEEFDDYQSEIQKIHDDSYPKLETWKTLGSMARNNDNFENLNNEELKAQMIAVPTENAVGKLNKQLRLKKIEQGEPYVEEKLIWAENTRKAQTNMTQNVDSLMKTINKMRNMKNKFKDAMDVIEIDKQKSTMLLKMKKQIEVLQQEIEKRDDALEVLNSKVVIFRHYLKDKDENTIKSLKREELTARRLRGHIKILKGISQEKSATIRYLLEIAKDHGTSLDNLTGQIHNALDRYNELEVKYTRRKMHEPATIIQSKKEKEKYYKDLKKLHEKCIQQSTELIRFDRSKDAYVTNEYRRHILNRFVLEREQWIQFNINEKDHEERSAGVIYDNRKKRRKYKKKEIEDKIKSLNLRTKTATKNIQTYETGLSTKILRTTETQTNPVDLFTGSKNEIEELVTLNKLKSDMNNLLDGVVLNKHSNRTQYNHTNFLKTIHKRIGNVLQSLFPSSKSKVQAMYHDQLQEKVLKLAAAHRTLKQELSAMTMSIMAEMKIKTQKWGKLYEESKHVYQQFFSEKMKEQELQLQEKDRIIKENQELMNRKLQSIKEKEKKLMKERNKLEKAWDKLSSEKSEVENLMKSKAYVESSDEDSEYNDEEYNAMVRELEIDERVRNNTKDCQTPWDLIDRDDQKIKIVEKIVEVEKIVKVKREEKEKLSINTLMHESDREKKEFEKSSMNGWASFVSKRMASPVQSPSSRGSPSLKKNPYKKRFPNLSSSNRTNSTLDLPKVKKKYKHVKSRVFEQSKKPTSTYRRSPERKPFIDIFAASNRATIDLTTNHEDSRMSLYKYSSSKKSTPSSSQRGPSMGNSMFPSLISKRVTPTTQQSLEVPTAAVKQYPKIVAFLNRMLKVRTRFIKGSVTSLEDLRQHLESTFRAFDTDGGGDISVGELQRGLSVLGHVVSESHVRSMMREIDKDSDYHIDIDEFIEAMMKMFTYT